MLLSLLAPARLRHLLLLAPLTVGAAPALPTQAPPTAPVVSRAAVGAAVSSAVTAAASAPAGTPVSAPISPTPAAAAATAKSGTVVVIEDDQVRIEEVRSRGRVQSIHVQSKLANVKAYDIQVAPPGRDPSQERGNAGQRTWSLFSF
jgi:hypothetical protein